MQTSEKILEILQQICDKFGIIMDENIYSLSELASTLTEQIVYRNLIFNGIHLIVDLIIIGILVKFFKLKHEEENLPTRFNKIVGLGDLEKSVLRNKAKDDKNFSLQRYIFEFIIMLVALFIIVPLGLSCVEYTIEIIKCFACPDVLVFDYIMEKYLNYVQ